MKKLLSVLGIFVFLFTTVVVYALTRNENEKSTVKNSRRASFYFQYTGTPGNEADRTLWQNITSGEPQCEGVNDGCLIEVDEAYTALSGSSRVLTQNVPVVTSGAHKNPDTSSPMIVNAFNKNP